MDFQCVICCHILGFQRQLNIKVDIIVESVEQCNKKVLASVRFEVSDLIHDFLGFGSDKHTNHQVVIQFA